MWWEIEPSNWIQERSRRSKGNKYKKKCCAEQAQAFALNRHQKLYLLGANCVIFDCFLLLEQITTLARKVSFPFIQSLIMWPDFCLLTFHAHTRLELWECFAFPTKSFGMRKVQNVVSSVAAPQLIQTAAEALKWQGRLPNCFYLPLLSRGWAADVNTVKFALNSIPLPPCL